MAADWMRFVGLPFKLGADPVDGKASDCIRLVLRVLEMNGLKPPAVERRWYMLLAKGDIETIKEEWFALTEQTMGPEQNAMTLLSEEGLFCIAIFVDGGLLTVRSTVGVQWVPLESLRPMNYRRLKDV